MNMRTLLTTGLIALFVGIAAPAVAEDAPETTAAERFELVLGNYETIPSREALDASIPDAQERLIAVAGDAKRKTWTRQRAISLLSFYPDATTLETLRGLASAQDAEIRRIALYTLARTFGKVADAALVDTLEKGLADKEARVREFTIRGLRYVDGDAATALLERIALGEGREAAIAKRALAKRSVGNAASSR